MEQRQFVFRVGAGDKVERIPVKLGARRPGLAEVLSGLQAGDRVVVEGTTRVRPGAEVKVIETRAVPGGTA
jgi:membrane fusion protein (multidrug efflux system)